MKNNKELKSVVLFITKFFAAYFLLLLVYNFYLSRYHTYNIPDPYSRFVAKSSASLSTFLGYESKAVDDDKQPWVWIYTEGKRTSYINEGCNAISIIIIFTAFIFAFSSSWKKTLLYVLIGMIIIQLMNIMRISLLNYIFRYEPQYGKAAHDYLFPLIIYGTIFLLWVVWVRYFVMKKVKPHEQVA